MKSNLIISACKKAKRTGPANWIMCCPAHEDRSPSMTLRELEDGRILLHCFAGCSVEQILGVLGLSFDALFPDKPITDFKPAHRRPWPAADVLAACADDIMHIAVFVANLGHKAEPEITPEQYMDFLRAAGRILEARRLALG